MECISALRGEWEWGEMPDFILSHKHPLRKYRVFSFKVIPFNCIAHPFCASIFAWLARARNLVGFLWKLSCWEKWVVVFSKTNSVTPLFYSIYLKKTRLCMIYPILKNFSLFNFQIFWLIHFYNLILGISLEVCMCSICLLFHYFYIWGNFKAFYCNTVLLSQE